MKEHFTLFFSLLPSQRCWYFITVYKVHFLKYAVNYGDWLLETCWKIDNHLEMLTKFDLQTMKNVLFFFIISMIGLYLIGHMNLTNGLLPWWRYLTRFDLLFILLQSWRDENRASFSSAFACISKLFDDEVLSGTKQWELVILRRLYWTVITFM